MATDAELIARVRAGDREAFTGLVLRYEGAAVATALAVLASVHDARDAAQDGFLTAYEKLNQLDEPERFGGWVMQIVRNAALAQRRTAGVREKHLALVRETPREEASVEEAPAMRLIGRLPEQECVVVSLRHLEGLTVAEIAAATGRPVGTVTKQLSRAYERMRGWLEEAGDE